MKYDNFSRKSVERKKPIIKLISLPHEYYFDDIMLSPILIEKCLSIAGYIFCSSNCDQTK